MAQKSIILPKIDYLPCKIALKAFKYANSLTNSIAIAITMGPTIWKQKYYKRILNLDQMFGFGMAKLFQFGRGFEHWTIC